MLHRLAHRLRATLTGPSSHDLADAMRQIEVLKVEVRELQDRVDSSRGFPETFRRIEALSGQARDLYELAATCEPFHARPGTMDAEIYKIVFRSNEYRLPPQFAATDVILDVGAHVGSFSVACLMRGAGRVVSFEPEPTNHALLAVNLSRFGRRADARCAAVWRSDAPPTTLHFNPSNDATNTGGGSMFAPESLGVSAATVSLDAVVAQTLAATGQKRIRLLKLDCEGSEYPVLLSATCLDRVEALCGEYHQVSGVIPAAQVGGRLSYTRNDLTGHLRGQGFRVETVAADPARESDGHGLGLFWATRAA